jgi:UDP-glucose 4-epimerase
MTHTNINTARRVLVTGGAGFIGSHVCQALQALGWETHALDSLATGDRGNVPAGVALHVADIRAEGDVRALLRDQRFDSIVHCAAQTSVERSMLDPDLDRDVNAGGTRHLLDAARVVGVGRFVFMSSGGAIYGETDEPATERSVPGPRSFYGIHKYVAEEFVRAGGLPFAVLRPSNVYGPRQRSDAEGGVIAIFCQRLSAGQRLEIHGDGTQARDFVYVNDVVDAVRLALESTDDVIWNVSSGTATSVIEAAQQVAQVIGCATQLDFRPRRAGDVTRSLVSPASLRATGRWGPPLRLEDGLRAFAGRAALAAAGQETG